MARIMIYAKLLTFSLLVINVCEIIIMLQPKEIIRSLEYNTCYLEAVSLEMNPSTSVADSGPIPLEDILLSEEQPLPGKTIFFLETSCPCSDSQYNMLVLNSRQACAIESAALHNPNLDVYVLFACPTSRHQFDPINDAILSYKNVKIRRVNLWTYAANTPIEDWIQKDLLFRSRFLANNISDLLRLLNLFRFGGIHMDMDVIVLRSFEDEPPNFVAAESEKHIVNGVIGLGPNGFGHKMAELLLRDFQENFNGDIWAHNGPRSIFNVMTHVCDTNDVTLMQQDPQRCHDIKVFHMNAFYAIRPFEWTNFFESKLANETLRRLKNSYLTHVWSHISMRRSLRVDSQAAYIQLAAQHCPKVLAATKYFFD